MSSELVIPGIQNRQDNQLRKVENLARPIAIIPDTTRVDLVGVISALIMEAAENGDMLPKTPKDILDLFSKGDSTILVGKDGKFLSHVAVTFRYKDGSEELGALCTAKGEEGKGYATDVTEARLIHEREVDHDKKIITLANEKSKGPFEKLGGTKMDPSELDKEVKSGCNGCKNKPPANANGEFKCCHTPYDLTNFVPRKPSGKVIFDSRASVNGKNGASHVSI